MPVKTGIQTLKILDSAGTGYRQLARNDVGVNSSGRVSNPPQ
jgi:hypothetical protein